LKPAENEKKETKIASAMPAVAGKAKKNGVAVSKN
jgi:hypothetical protein